MADAPRETLTRHSSLKHSSEISNRDEGHQTRRSRRHLPIKRPPRAPNENPDTQPATIRRTRTVPAQDAEEMPQPVAERRSRRNLSRAFADEFGDDILLDSNKRISSSRRNLQREPSERVLKPTLSKRGGRAATPLDIPFAPNPAFARTMSAETKFEELLDMEFGGGETPSPLRRTRTYGPTSHTEALTRQGSVREEAATKLETELTPYPDPAAQEASTSGEGALPINDSAKKLADPRDAKSALGRPETAAVVETLNEETVVNIDPPSRKQVAHRVGAISCVMWRVQVGPPSRKSSKKLPESGPSRKSQPKAAQEIQPVSSCELVLHYASLLFVQYPFKYHRQWLEKMYRANRLQRPANHKPSPDWALTSTASSLGNVRGGLALPSLPEDSDSVNSSNARARRRTQMDTDVALDEFGAPVESHHRKRTSRQSLQFSAVKPPPGHLPRSRNISIGRSQRKKSRKSVEIFGDIIHALGINTKGGRLKLPFGWSEMDESELSGFQARLYKFIKRQHKGRLARAYDHLVHPLDSMQKKHRRSTNKTRLLNAIDKHRAQKFYSGVDMVKTRMFLLGQWVFEALSPPKYTKKPMLFTVLFPLVLILFFGFMAGEYPLWRETQGDNIDYKFGPVELATWLFRAEKWRTFDDGFLIAWGARYLPLVTTESWRWLFSMLVHENFAHLGGNLFLFVILSWSLESKYGFTRTGLVCWLSGISGNFMSAALEDACGLVLGASGCVFGLAAFYMMDVMGDFKSVSFPCLRLIGICTFLSAFIIALTSHQEASHLSHIGGFLCGMGLSVVLVPRFIDERVEACLPWLALFSVIVLLCAFPLVVLISVIPNLQCAH